MYLLKKSLFVLLILFLILSCGGSDDGPTTDDGPVVSIDDDEPMGGNNPEEPEVIVPQSGNTVVNVLVELPSDSEISTDDLNISSLFTQNKTISNSGNDLEVFQGNSLELNYVKNKSDNIVLMGYSNPSFGEKFDINAESTAMAMVMIHPWTMDMSIEAKMETMQIVSKSQEFLSFAAVVENAISQNIDNPLETQEVIAAYNIFFDDLLGLTGKDKSQRQPLYEADGPLEIESIDGSNVKLTNLNSSAAYSVKITGDNGSSETSLLKGVKRVAFDFETAINLISTGSTGLGEPTSISLPIALDQKYTVYATSGFSGPDSPEKLNASVYNGGRLVFGLLGSISGIFKAFESDDCIIAIGDFFISEYAQLIEKINLGQLTTSDLIKQFLSVMANRIAGAQDILVSCANADTLIKAGGLQKLVTGLSVFTNVVNGISFGVLALDIATDKSEVNFCFEKENSEINPCPIVTVQGEIDFKRTPIGLEQELTFTVQNNGFETYSITGFTIPFEEYSILPELGTSGISIEPNETQEFEIKFLPKTVGPYNGELTIVTNDLSGAKGTLPLKGEAVNALKSNRTELNFEKLLVGETSEPQTITLKNDSDVDIILRAVDPIDGYSYSIPEQTIEAGQSIPIEVRFKPTDDFEDYNKQLIFKTDTDQADLVVELKGDGFKGLTLEVLSDPKDLDFGQVSTNSDTGETKSLRIINPTDIAITINGFEFTGEAQGGYTTSRDTEIQNNNGIELIAGATLDFTITFKPETERTFNGDFIVDNTESQDAPLRILIRGEGVLNQLTVNPDFLDFGEVELNGTPSVRTFELTNNLQESATITISTGHSEVKIDNWADGTTLNVGQSVTISASFTPNENTTSLNNNIQVEATNLNESVTVNYIGNKKENNEIDLEALLLSKSWTLAYNNSIVNSNCNSSYTSETTDNENGTSRDSSNDELCINGYPINGIVFLNGGSIQHSGYLKNTSSSTDNETSSTTCSYSVSGNVITIIRRYEFSFNESYPDGQGGTSTGFAQRTEIAKWTGTYINNQNIFILSHTIESNTTGGNTNSTTNYNQTYTQTYNHSSNMIMR